LQGCGRAVSALRHFGWIVFAAALAACGRRPHEDPAYAHLPHINLVHVLRGGIAMSRTAGEVRYEVETLLASDGIAVAGGPYDDKAPEFSFDLVDQGVLPGGSRIVDLPGVNMPSADPYRGTNMESLIDVGDMSMGLRGDTARIVAGAVYMRKPHEPEPHLLGEFRGVIGNDFASSVKVAEVIAGLIRRGLTG
jgi:hypothetical protein